VIDVGTFWAGSDVEAVLQEVGTDLTEIEVDLGELEAEIAAVHSYVPVMAQSPNLVTTDGTPVWIPLTLADGTPVMMTV
jgi:hypothetical protein